MKKVLIIAVVAVFMLGCAANKQKKDSKELKENIQELTKWPAVWAYTIPLKDVNMMKKMSKEEYEKYGNVRTKSVTFFSCNFDFDGNITFNPGKGVLEVSSPEKFQFLSPCKIYQIYFDSQEGGSKYGYILGEFTITGKSKIVLNQRFERIGSDNKLEKECVYKTVVLENKDVREVYECRSANDKIWYEKVDEGVEAR